MAKKANKVNIETLLEQYDKARSEAKDAETKAKDLNAEIKLTLGATEEVDTPEYVCTYKFDKDKEIESFDAEKFEEKDPKGFKAYLGMLDKADKLAKKYTKKTVVPGARKLIVVRKNEGDE